MMTLTDRIDAFVKLGQILRTIGDNQTSLNTHDQYNPEIHRLEQQVVGAHLHNGWFTEEMVRSMLKAIGESLKKDALEQWLQPYADKIKNKSNNQKVAVIMAGNIPAVGFHDFLTVLIAGQLLKAKMSAEDNKLIPAMADLLMAIEPGFQHMILFEEGKLSGFDAVIATGSNNTARYFDYYFGKYPNIIRKNRNGIAALDGSESSEDLGRLADDCLRYFGLGCRNVSKLFVPEGYDFSALLEIISRRTAMSNHSKYFNNYEYNKAIYLINGTPHLDTGNLLLVENEALASPVSVIYYSYYTDLSVLKNTLKMRGDDIQCLVSGIAGLDHAIPFGTSQQPQLWDYADGIDTMGFLLSFD